MDTTNANCVWRFLVWICLIGQQISVNSNISGYNCDFSRTFCGWRQDKTDQFEWSRTNGSTPSNYTGPSGDHTTGHGYYIHIDTSAPRGVGDNARLVGPSLTTSTSVKCFSFWYKVLGTHITKLHIYMKKGNKLESRVWTGTHGGKWQLGRINVRSATPIQIVIEGVRGVGYLGDIAIDDTYISNGACYSAAKLACSFELPNCCSYKPDRFCDFEWARIAGGTSSRQTDHTHGTTAGHYMYIETSAPRSPGQKARYVSPFVSTTSSVCVTFYYRIFESVIGSLNVYVNQRGNLGSPVWTRKMDQQHRWMPGKITLNQLSASQLVFEGIVGNSSQGEIAIDDITVNDGACAYPDCGTVSSPRHGEVHVSSTTYQSEATYSCLPGYFIQGSNITQCLDTGMWSDTQSICMPIDCGNLTSPDHGEVRFSTTVYQSTAAYTCDSGYVLQGSNITECVSSGKWDKNSTICKSIDCGPLSSPSHGEIHVSSTTYQSEATYSCLPGYFIQGAKMTQCLDTGMWSDTETICMPMDCGNLTSPDHGEVSFSTTVYQSTAAYTCDSGYILQGSNITECVSSGKWDRNSTTCKPIDCGTVSSPRHGEVHVSSTTYQSEATYSCLPGYLIQGSNRTQCLDTGMWNDTHPACNPIDCKKPDLPMNGYVIANSTIYESVAIFYCNAGYVQLGSKISTCLSAGEWDKKPPSCRPSDDVKEKFCSGDVDERDTTWDATVSGTSVTIPCSSVNQDLVGNVSRYCTVDGSWLFPEYDCLRAEFKQLEQTIQAVLTNVSAPAIDEVLSSLSSVTQVTDSQDGLYSGELSKATDMLEIIANVSSGVIIGEEQSQSFVQTVGNLLDTKNQGAWHSMTQASDTPSQHNKKAEKASKILKSVGKYADAIAKTMAETNQTERVVPNKNMVLLVENIGKPKDIKFPGTSVIRKSNISAHSPSFQLDKESVKGATSYSGVIYKNLSHILPSTTVKMGNSASTATRDINSAVLAVQLHSNLTHHLPSPIVLQFNYLEARYRDASCVFWNEQGQGWDNSGCRRTSSNVTTTVCECDHLTNFAILMSPWREESVSTVAIDVLSYVGCSISTVCLLITIVSHILYWRYLKPHFRTVILMHLSVALVFSYILFLFGADKTENRDMCTAMASLLHYIYLTVFFIMLAECIDVAWIVLLPLKHSFRPKWTLAAAWALPAVIVGVSLGVTKLRGYGTNSYCWLSTENGLIWAFIGPALLVILCNLIVLILVIKVVCQTQAMKEKDALARVRSSLWCLLILLPLTGCTWIIGIFYINEDTEWIQYLFVICNTLQGFVIFLCHCLFNKQMVEAIRQKRKRRQSSTFHSESTSKSSRFHISFRKAYSLTETSSTGTQL